MIKVICGFDGSCPQCRQGIKKNKKGTYILYPGYRQLKGDSEECPGKGSRFYTRIENNAGSLCKITLRVNWEKPERVNGHDIGYFRHEKESEWTMIPGFSVGKSVIEYRLEILPGVTHIGLYPEYNYSQCADFVRKQKEAGISVKIIGKSRQERDIWLLNFPSSNKNAKNFFIQARDHAYETAGSYCIEGITGFLRSEESLNAYLRSKFHFYIVPMTNPDGVYNGMSRLTWEKGADMNRVYTVPDAAHTALKKAMDIVKPFVHMNVHNWTNKFVDGLLSNEKDIAERILAYLPGDGEHFKRWYVQTTADFLKDIKADRTPDKHKSWKNYCKEQFDGIGVNFEFPWFALNTADMRAKGKKAFIAFALAVIECYSSRM